MSAKNIVVLTGSPRKNGNSERMAEAFIKGALSAGHSVVKFETAGMEIGGCRACNACWTKGKPCVFADDFETLATRLEEADVLVFATPLYWATFTSQIKAAIDKMYAYTSKNRIKPLKIRQCLLMVCGGDDEKGMFDGIVATYREIVRYLDCEDRGVLAVPNVKEKGEIEATDALREAEALGRSL